MPKGQNPNSKANLIQFSGKSREEVEAIQAKGGRRSGVTRRKLKTMREELKARLTAERAGAMLDKLLSMAEDGNILAMKLVLQIIGEDPAQKIEFAGSDGKPLVVRWLSEKEAEAAENTTS